MTHIICRVLIFQIDISPDTGNVEMKQQAGERLAGFNTYVNGKFVILPKAVGKTCR